MIPDPNQLQTDPQIAQAPANSGIAPNAAPSAASNGVPPQTAAQQTQTPQPQQEPTLEDRLAKAPKTAEGIPVLDNTGHLQNIYRNIFEGMAGGPTRVIKTDSQGNPYIEVRHMATKKSIGAGILAGALSGMMAGMQAPDKFNQAGGRDLSPSAQAGAAAGQAQATKNQRMSDDERAKSLALLDHNLKMHQQDTALQNMQRESLDASKDSLDKSVSDASPILAAMDAASSSSGTTSIKKSGISEAELAQMLHSDQTHMLKDSIFPDGVVPKFGNDGKVTGYERTWTVYDPTALVKMEDAIRAKYPKLENVANGTLVPVRVFWHDYDQMQHLDHAQAVTKQIEGKLPPSHQAIDFENDPTLRPLISYMGQMAGHDPDEVIARLNKAGAPQNAVNRLVNLYGPDYDEQTFINKREGAKKAADLAGNPDRQPADPDDIQKLPSRLKALGLTAAQADAVLSELPKTGATRADVAKVLENARHQQDTNANQAKNQANPDDIDVLSDQLLEPNNLTAMKDIGGRGNQRTQILAAAARKAKARGIPFDIGLINQRTKFLGEYEDPKGRAATNRQAINNVLQHAGDLSDLNELNRRSNVKILNTPISKLKDQFGDQVYTQYQTASGVLKDELSLYFAGGYAPSKDQQDMWDRIQSNAATPAQTEAFAKEVVRLAARRANTFNQQFKTNMGYDDPNMITPAAKAAAEHLGMGNEVAQFASGGQLGQKQSKQPTQQPNTSAPNPADIVRTGNLNGKKVFQLKNGQTVYADGTAVQ
jgi:hypothetical protein